MNRRNIFKSIAGLLAAPAVVKAAPAIKAGGSYTAINANSLMAVMSRLNAEKCKKAMDAFPMSQRSECVLVNNLSTGSVKAMTKADYEAERRRIDLFGATPQSFNHHYEPL